MRNLVFLATAWGRKHGGINAFNEDLASAVADLLEDEGRVFCAVLAGDPPQELPLPKSNVTLIPILGKKPADEFDTSWAHDIELWLEKNCPGERVDWWIGHDVTSGACALKAAELFSGRAAIIHHMSYARYQGFKTSNSVENERKHAKQAQLFAADAKIFAVGPLLKRSAEEYATLSVTMLVPGFPDATSLEPRNESRLKAISFGRLDAGSDAIKLGSLAAAAFGEAVKRAYLTPSKWKPLEEGQLTLLGAGEAGGEDAAKLEQIARDRAGRNVLVHPLPYDEDPVAVQGRLATSNLAMMLSLHEGFGLVGWEAIAAGAPLILTKRSGLYELLEEQGGPVLGCVHAVDIKGDVGAANFREDDVQVVAEAIMQVAGDLKLARRNASSLKDLVQTRLAPSWRKTAQTFLRGLEEAVPNSGQESPAAVRAIQERSFSMATHTPSDGLDAHRAAITVHSQSNLLPHCAELQVGTTQGSRPDDFDLLPELRFGRHVLAVDGLRVTYGLRAAVVSVALENCQFRPGWRLGDDQAATPHIAATGGGRWHISGPRDEGQLFRKALGDEPLCGIQAGADAQVTISVSCAPQDLDYSFSEPKPVNTTRIIEAFLTRCLRDDDTGDLTLCQAVMRAGATT